VTFSPSVSSTHQSEGSSKESHILAEVDHLGLPPLRIFNLPEIMHERRNSGQKASHGRRTQFRLYADDEAGAAERESNSGSRDSYIRHGDTFRVSVLRHRFALHEMMDSVIEEEAAEDSASEEMREFHNSSLTR
jgi:hypothetical protein